MSAPQPAPQGRDVKIPSAEPWEEEVNGIELFDELSEEIRRYVVIPKGAADAIACWCAGTYLMDSWYRFPRLYVRSPEKGCGKTTLLDAITPLVCRPMRGDGISTPILFRLTEISRPTFVLDEVDGWVKGNEEMRSMINSGYQHGGQILRCSGDNHDPKAFDVYAAMVLAGIGVLPDTVMDRSIIVRLERAMRSDKFHPFNRKAEQRLALLARKLARWSKDNEPAITLRIEKDTVQLPDGLINRAADNWRPLFVIAQTVGGEWPNRVESGFMHLSGQIIEEEDKYMILLRDCREIFDETGAKFLTGEELTGQLIGREDSPWSEYNRGSAITKSQVARLLRRYHVFNKPHWVSSLATSKRCYLRSGFEGPWGRYLPPSKCKGVRTPENKGQSANIEVLGAPPALHIEKGVSANEQGHSNTLTDSGTHTGSVPMLEGVL